MNISKLRDFFRRFWKPKEVKQAENVREKVEGERCVPNETAFDEFLLSAMDFGARWEAEQAKERN